MPRKVIGYTNKERRADRQTNPIYEYTCLRCNRVFQSRSEYPDECPHCRDRFWDTKAKA